MAPKPITSATTAADMTAARRRSALYGLDPATATIPHRGPPGPAATTLTELSSPVVEQLISQITGSSLAVVMADRDGRLTDRQAPDRNTLAALDHRSIDVGYSLAEADVGTNGVGTSLETQRPALVVGDQHFLDCFKGFTCAHAPIVQPITGRVEGTIGLVCPAEDTSPLLLSTAAQLAAQITGALLDQASPEERFLLENFLRLRKGQRSSVATIGKDVLIASPQAQRHLADFDHHQLWERLEVVLRSGRAGVVELERASQEPVVLRCVPLHRGGELQGAAVQVTTVRPSTDRGRRHQGRPQLGDLVGVSQLWQAMGRDALHAAQLDEPVLIVGERGSGRRAIALAIAERQTRRIEIFDSGQVLLDGPRLWLERVRDSISEGATLVFRRVDELPDPVAAALAELVGDGSATRFLATSQSSGHPEPGRARLLRHLNVLRIDVPPLRARRDDIAPLALRFARDLGRQQLSRPVLATLSRQSWPGNAAELHQAVRSAHAKARTGAITVEHLPRHLRREPSRTPLHGLRQQEAEAIVAAINATATRAEAAQQLGISRATLYRRIDAYGIELPD